MADVEAVRHRSPLVHSITNYVVMNNTANALLAIRWLMILFSHDKGWQR